MIASNLINEGIYANMEKLTDKNKVGWSVKLYECDACGKVIWGRGLSHEVYCRWEELQRGVEPEQEQPTKELVKRRNLDLVSFSCRHCYHKSCLEHLGNTDGYSCVICADKV
jgi:hypothetical protein